MRKPAFCICENKGADHLRCNREAISAVVFATRIVQSLYFINPKFQASSYLLWLYSPVCVGPGQKPRTPVFSERDSFIDFLFLRQSYDVTVNLDQIKASGWTDSTQASQT